MSQFSSSSLRWTKSPDGTVEVTAAGAWTASEAAGLAASVERASGEIQDRSMSLRLDGIEALDTFGAYLLGRLTACSGANGRKVSLIGVSERQRVLLDAMARVGVLALPSQPKPGPFAAVEALGRAMVDVWSSLLVFVTMLGAVGAAAWRVVLNPRRFRLTSTVHQIDRVALQAVPIVLLITTLIGAIIAQQGIFHFRKFGADTYVVDLVGILVLREIGVLLVAIMVAGRSGSAYTAELGSMKMREEIDALRTMGLDPVEVLILPRVIALVCALPLLTFLGAMAALVGGGLVAWSYGGMSPIIFIARMREAISVTHFEVGILKAPFMALVIGVVACAEGLRVQGSSESLGLRTTASVVESIFVVIVLDGLFAVFFAAVGM